MDRVDDLLGLQYPNSQPRVAATDGGIIKAGNEGEVLDAIASEHGLSVEEAAMRVDIKRC